MVYKLSSCHLISKSECHICYTVNFLWIELWIHRCGLQPTYSAFMWIDLKPNVTFAALIVFIHWAVNYTAVISRLASHSDRLEKSEALRKKWTLNLCIVYLIITYFNVFGDNICYCFGIAFFYLRFRIRS